MYIVIKMVCWVINIFFLLLLICIQCTPYLRCGIWYTYYTPYTKAMRFFQFENLNSLQNIILLPYLYSLTSHISTALHSIQLMMWCWCDHPDALLLLLFSEMQVKFWYFCRKTIWLYDCVDIYVLSYPKNEKNLFLFLPFSLHQFFWKSNRRCAIHHHFSYYKHHLSIHPSILKEKRKNIYDLEHIHTYAAYHLLYVHQWIILIYILNLIFYSLDEDAGRKCWFYM